MGGGGGCCIGNCCIANCGFCCVAEGIRKFFCSDSCCVGNSSGPTESELHAKEVANELAEMKDKRNETAKELENEVIEYINRSLNSFLREIGELNQNDYSGKKLNINIDLIKQKNEELKNRTIGCIGNELNKRLVQTDKELSLILEERDKKKRKDNFEKFVNKVQTQAIEKFIKEIEKAVNEQSALVRTEIDARLNEVNKSMADSIAAYTTILESKKKSGQELEQMQVNYMYQSGLCDLLLYEAEE